MLIYLLGLFYNKLVSAIFNIIPVIETPQWFTDGFYHIIELIMGFDYYLPLTETIEIVMWIVIITFTWKMIKIVLGLVNIDLNK